MSFLCYNRWWLLDWTKSTESYAIYFQIHHISLKDWRNIANFLVDWTVKQTNRILCVPRIQKLIQNNLECIPGVQEIIRFVSGCLLAVLAAAGCVLTRFPVFVMCVLVCPSDSGNQQKKWFDIARKFCWSFRLLLGFFSELHIKEKQSIK